MRYRLSGFELDTDRLELRADGELRALEPQVFDVLRHLVENADRLVSRDELIDVVWGGRIISDATVSTRINAVRRALGDNGQRQALIKTIPRRGFRFVGEVSGEDGNDEGDKPEEAQLAVPLTLPPTDKPSIAVLPFTNLSGDPEQEYFSDGITEDIIAALSRVGWFFVIARNSSFTFKGRAVEVRQIAERLGVRYVLEGSVRRSTDRLRVTAQLIHAETGNHIWADRYDGILEDVFDFQDSVTASVVGAVEPKLRRSEIDRVIVKRSDNLGAYDLLLRAYQNWFVFSKDGNRQAQIHIDEALKIDPGYGPALALGAQCRALAAFFYWSEDRERDRTTALQMMRRSLEVAGDDATVLRRAGNVVCLILKDHSEARALIDKSLALDCNAAESWSHRGWANIWDERPGDAKDDLVKAIRLSPLDPMEFSYANGMTYAHVGLGEYHEALEWARRSVRSMPQWIASQRGLALALALTGRLEEARAVGREILRIDSKFTIGSWIAASPFVGGALIDRLARGLRLAGLPE